MARINKELVALNLLTCATNKEAAEKSNISVTTLCRLKKNKDFQQVVQNVKKSIFQDTIDKAQGYSLESLEILRQIAANPKAKAASRVSAAKAILDLSVALHEDENIVQRLANIERELSSGN